MKIIALSLLAVTFCSWSARASDSPVGHWQYFMKVYKGQEIPEHPDETLRLRYELSDNGQSRLYWWHEGQGDHCARRGRYHLEGDVIVDHVTWIDPSNSYGCARDPDMQNGKTTKTPYQLHNGNLILRIPLGDEELFYVWKKINPEEK